MKFRITIFFLVTILAITGCSEEPVDENIFGSLTGKVVSKGDNIPLENVKVSSNPFSTTVFTDVDGNFIIDEVQIGEYSFQAELKEFQTAFEAINVLEDKTVNIVFELDSLSVANLSPVRPILFFPEEGAENILAETEFIWSSSNNDDDEISYTLELRNGATNEIVLYEEIIDTTLVVENLLIGQNYFWQVSANDGVNVSVESSIRGFATKGNETNRFLYTRNIDGNNVIFSGGEPLGLQPDDGNQNQLQLTGSNFNSYRPVKNSTLNKIGFLRTLGTETHLFVMNSDGSNLTQVTRTVPVAGFRLDQLEFTWYDNGARLYYPNFNKLYSINHDGSDLRIEYEVAAGTFISEIAVSPATSLVTIKTNDSNGYNARIVLVDVNTDVEQNVIVSGGGGALGGLDFSLDGSKILFTRDISGAENTAYRQLDTRIFEHMISSGINAEIDTEKVSGTNDLDPKYSPDEGSIIFVNTSNDGVSESSIYRTYDNNVARKQLLFTNATMANWE